MRWAACVSLAILGVCAATGLPSEDGAAGLPTSDGAAGTHRPEPPGAAARSDPQRSTQAGTGVPIVAPAGFRVERFAGDELAHDVFCMTLDARGRVVVSGRGYLKILTDEDGDGRADRAIRFADGPQTGAQGLFFDGPDLLAIGDQGLLRYRDRDGDDRADGPPEILLKLKCGGEHHAHAVRRGPDGWWYVIAGNMSEVDAAYVTRDGSPVRKPRAGVLLRLSPDFSDVEIVAHGFRNAYDFDFAAAGETFAYDSDGERDVSLPWYRPTRVFHVVPGSDAGWVSRSWKHPNDFFEMPPVLLELGRGSPTGVAVYRHRQFPPEYSGAVFVCDWTFGRVVAIPRRRDGATWRGRPILFLRSAGEYGFAPTDLAVAPDGSLYVSVGGRGTQGSVFRIWWEGTAAADESAAGTPGEAASNAPARRAVPTAGELAGRGSGEAAKQAGKVRRTSPAESPQRRLHACLAAPQPLAAWSRARWQPLARALGSDAFVRAAADASLSSEQRVRALEILAELFGGAGGRLVQELAGAADPQVRAAAIWALRNGIEPAEGVALLSRYLADRDPLVVRRTLETLLRQDPVLLGPECAGALLQAASASDRHVRAACARVLARLSEPTWHAVLREMQPGDLTCAVTLAWAEAWRASDANLERVRRVWSLAEALLADARAARGSGPEASEPSLLLDVLRLLQVVLGDVGVPRGVEPVFAGYTSRTNLGGLRGQLDWLVAALRTWFPTGRARIDQELTRVGAMIRLDDPRWLEHVLQQLTPQSAPVLDVHYLIVAACCPAPRTPRQTAVVAEALLSLQEKIERLELRQDRNWDDRMEELFRELGRHDPALWEAVASHPKLGRPQHAVFARVLPDRWIIMAADAFARRAVAEGDDYPWNSDVVFLLGRSGRPEHSELLRRQFDRPTVRAAVLLVLAERPEPRDRPLFVAGLQSFDVAVVGACAKALRTLGAGNAPDEFAALLRALRGLSSDSRTLAVAEDLWALIRMHALAEHIPRELLPEKRPQRATLEKLTEWFVMAFPELGGVAAGPLSAERLEVLDELLQRVPWESGDAGRGAKLYRRLGCAQCHEGGRAVGPSLSGVARRFSRRDLLIAVAFPNRDVSPRYQTTQVATTAGSVFTGVVVYESVDGLILQDAAGRTLRIEAEDIEARSVQPVSLMPTGLLDKLQPRDVADLYAFLKTL